LVDTEEEGKIPRGVPMEKRARRKFTTEYKAEVVRLVRDSGKSLGQVSRELGLTESAVRHWVSQSAIDASGGGTGALTTAERAELVALRREARTLRMEREILKKAAAFFAKENQ
jgi:transposase-like protein